MSIVIMCETIKKKFRIRRIEVVVGPVAIVFWSCFKCFITTEMPTASNAYQIKCLTLKWEEPLVVVMKKNCCIAKITFVSHEFIGGFRVF